MSFFSGFGLSFDVSVLDINDQQIFIKINTQLTVPVVLHVPSWEINPLEQS